MTMHNEEGKLFDAVFHKLLTLGVVVVSVAALVWLAWAVVRMGQITHDASPPEAVGNTEQSTGHTPEHGAMLAGTRRAAPPLEIGIPDEMIDVLFRPIASLAGAIDRRVSRFPSALARAAEDAAFFRDGPS
jgi:hypothetical protein